MADPTDSPEAPIDVRIVLNLGPDGISVGPVASGLEAAILNENDRQRDEEQKSLRFLRALTNIVYQAMFAELVRAHERECIARACEIVAKNDGTEAARYERLQVDYNDMLRYQGKAERATWMVEQLRAHSTGLGPYGDVIEPEDTD